MWMRYGIGNKSRIENLPIKQVEKMISIKINSVVYDLPQSWDEVSVKQYVEIESKREEGIVACFLRYLPYNIETHEKFRTGFSSWNRDVVFRM